MKTTTWISPPSSSKADKDPLNLRDVHMTRSVEDSKKINNVDSPCIIVSASGMATGGRILHHLDRRLPDDRGTPCCWSAIKGMGTNGRALQDGAQFLRLYGQEVPVRAEIVTLDQLSAHAGRSELLQLALRIHCCRPRQTFLVHGEPAALDSFHGAITSRFHWPVTVPAYLQSFDLST